MRANVTRAAEGLDRRAFTVDEVLRMEAAGILSEDENLELIEGELAPMRSKTHAHVIERGPGETLTREALPGFAVRLSEV
jgi:hypothetical protein